MKRLSVLIVLATLACAATSALAAAPARDRQMHELKKLHKQEWKELKEQQRATNKVMEQHLQTPEARQRLKRNLKMQRQLLRDSQKAETRRLKGNHLRRQPPRPLFRSTLAPR